LSNLASIVDCVEECTQLEVHPRHPYAGDFVFTAFSGSHQDAIRKGLLAQSAGGPWEVPYLPIDPKDIDVATNPLFASTVIGKGRIAFLMESDYGVQLPRNLLIEFSQIIQQLSDSSGKEVTSPMIWEAFRANTWSLGRRLPAGCSIGRWQFYEPARCFPHNGCGSA